MLTQGAWRLARAGSFALVAVALSLTAHVAAGGSPPSVGVVAATTFGILCPATLLAGRRIGRPTMLVMLGLAQLGLHTAFERLGGHAESCTPSGHHHAQTVTCGSSGAAAEHVSTGPLMVLAHIAATVLLALLLARGEDILWALAACFGLRLPATSGRLPVSRRLAHPVPAVAAPPPAFLRLPRRRGPPQAALV
ncbi:hypothetical protein [Luteipulveratus mongoliensis]|uniref:hypothetical protein n=1 Tax=Luteipulveratus mongoliensis TaxID=571913 RepID=UPI000696B8D3|nr:hypothetical protein [Luteipulveratus mongoliensis]